MLHCDYILCQTGGIGEGSWLECSLGEWVMGEILLIVVAVVFVGVVLFFASGIRIVPNSRVGVVEKVVSRKGSVKEGFIALSGEAGYQPRVLRGGWHILNRFQYRVHSVP